MRNLYYILQKEFLLIFRDRAILRMIFIMPVMQLLLIPLAADYEVKHIAIAIVDHDHSSDSQRLVQKVEASNYFRIVAAPRDYQSATVLMDDEALEQILNNLFSNVEKYGMAGGKLEIRTRQEQDRTHITIRDFGPGIPKAEWERVFQPFYRISSKITDGVAGAGMGLGIARDRMVVVSKGEESPVCTEENEGCWARNRRGHFVITAK